MTANFVHKDPSDQIAGLNKPTTNPGHGTNVTNSGVGAKPLGLSYPLFRCERELEGGLRPLIMWYFSLCFLG